MNARLVIFLGLLAAPGASFAAGGLTLLGVRGQAGAEAGPALAAEQAHELCFLLPQAASFAETIPGFFQVAGGLARPMEAGLVVAPDPADSRLLRVGITPPAVVRVTRCLRLGKFGPFPLVVFPAAVVREDLAPLAEGLRTSGLRLAVCGESSELRAYLRGQGLDFTDLGASPPAQLGPGTLLVGQLSSEAWERLVTETSSAGARLLAFVDDPALMPGVYTQTDPSGLRYLAKITLPLPPLLATDPRARETLHTLLFAALAPVLPRASL
jgi:hypothetical protein